MILISETPFDAGEHLNEFSKTNISAGAVSSFLGQVRDENGTVKALELQSYQGVTEQGIAQAEAHARERFSLTDVMIIHRIGAMKVGEPIVFVLVAAKHRRDAIEACDFLMDYLKTEAMFWKKQTGKMGSQWIEPRAQDYQDYKRWS